MPPDDTISSRSLTGGREHDAAMADLSGFQRDLLWRLAECQPCNGLEVETLLEEYYGETVNHSHVYANLDRLVETGFVDKRDGDDARANEYRITPFARTTLDRRREWLNARSGP
ncbi:transcriptional regulator, PadR family [Halarchaeum acidiphilum MH1-52-1]|uniref:Transcriptional regulator, PadR family n=1 Tax=Halarchaeum acidiphilum MH1-52-1 TaxID=1261545 RepID=U3A1T4_9EURY|nr:PadR family transcriptional regulator [Halarchaeum acidiphilum]GAD51614.1 transcriptional regulator, PadR family [Halarchaeum acidiphilum MH1-52-1]